MASSAAGWLAALTLVATAGIAALVTSKQAASAAPPQNPVTPPKQGSTAWIAASQLNPGDTVRVAIAPADIATLAKSFGVTADVAGLQTILASPSVQRTLNVPGTILLWMPGDPNLPSDWPSSDPDVAHNFHAQFTYGGAAPLLVAMSPVPFLAWTRRGLGVGGVYGGGAGGVFGGGLTKVNPGLNPGALGGGAGIINQPIDPPAGAAWHSVNAGQQVTPGTWLRASMSTAQVRSYLAQSGASTVGSPQQLATALAEVLAERAASIVPASVAVWPPGSAGIHGAMQGWPSNDPNLGGNFHVQYKTASAITIGSGQDAEWMGA